MTLIEEKILVDFGSFKVIRQWYEGWVHIELDITKVIRYIHGLTGKETEVTLYVIYPGGTQ